MNRGQGKTLLFAICAIVSVGSLIAMITILTGGTSVAEASIGTDYIVQLEDSITILDEIEVSQNG